MFRERLTVVCGFVLPAVLPAHEARAECVADPFERRLVTSWSSGSPARAGSRGASACYSEKPRARATA
jgi:hypothetical protein